MGIKLTGVNKANVAKNLAKNYKYVTHLDRAIDKGEFAWSADFAAKAGDDAWHPSGDCTPSMRDLWLKASGQTVERRFSTALRKTFMVGHFWHAYLQHITVEILGFATWDQVEVRGKREWGEQGERRFFGEVHDPEHSTTALPYHWATGSADVCPALLPVHGEYLIDYKTMNANDFRKPDPPEWAVDKWECQLNVYMDWFDIDQAILVGACKDNPHEFKEFIFRRNQDLVDAIYGKWELVSQCIDEDIEMPEDEEWDLPLTGPVKS